MADQPFHEWLLDRMRDRGYDVDSKRGGGRAKLAEEIGVTRGQVGRILAGTSSPDPKTLVRISRTLGIPIGEMVERATDEPVFDSPIAQNMREFGQMSNYDLEIVANMAGIPKERQDDFIRAMKALAAGFGGEIVSEISPYISKLSDGHRD